MNVKGDHALTQSSITRPSTYAKALSLLTKVDLPTHFAIDQRQTLGWAA
jgi:hypothetical protein